MAHYTKFSHCNFVWSNFCALGVAININALYFHNIQALAFAVDFSVENLNIAYLNVYSFQDESVLIWFSGKEEKHLKLSHVSRIISGQRTVSFFLPTNLPFFYTWPNFIEFFALGECEKTCLQI